MQRHKRLIVPQLGAFIVKEPDGVVLFSELLRRDDGVLRGLLAEGGMNELEAAGAIDRFVFEIRHAVQQGGEFPLEGFGRFRPGANGTLAFVYEPAAENPEIPQPDPVPETSRPEESGAVPVLRAAESADKPRGGTAAAQPDPSLKGLRYGKPLKTTAAYTYAQPRAKRKTDRFLLVAIIAAIIAVAAIAFGYYVSGTGEQPAETELPRPAPAETTAPVPDAVSAPDAASASDRSSAQPSTQTPEP